MATIKYYLFSLLFIFINYQSKAFTEFILSTERIATLSEVGSDSFSNVSEICDSMTTFIELLHTNPPSCCFNLNAGIPVNNYFNYIAISISSATVISVTPDINYTIQNQGNSYFEIHHSSGFIPDGSITPASFCFNVISNPFTIKIYYISNSNGIIDTCKYETSQICPVEDCCDSTTSTLVPIAQQNCCWDFHSYSSKRDCFSQICISVNSGVFTNINTTNGWSYALQSNGDLCFTPNSGVVPTGNINPGSFCLVATNNPVTFTVHYYDINGNEVPDCQRTIVQECSGTQCSCDGLSNQIVTVSTNPGICCYDLNALIPYGSCYFGMSVSVNSGSFSNVNPMPGYAISSQTGSGFYIAHSSGFLPAGNIIPVSFCVTGSTFYSITVQYYYKDANGIDQRCVFTEIFECPKVNDRCDCDSLVSNILQTGFNPGVCCYKINHTIPTANCILHMAVSVSSGLLTNVIADTNYTVSNLTNNSFTLNYSSGFLPSGAATPVDFCVSGSSIYTITVNYFYAVNGAIDTCIISRTFDCPTDTSDCDKESCTGNRQWTKVTNVIGGIVYDLKTYNCKLYACGQFNLFDNQLISNIAVWDGSTWSAVGGGLNGNAAYTMEVHGGKLYVGGQFSMAGTTPVNNIAVWDGSTWADVGGGVQNGINTAVRALLSTSNGLIVAGAFTLLGNSIPANNIALWNSVWTAPYGPGIPPFVKSLILNNNELYAGGAMNSVNNILKWNGAIWQPLQNGITTYTSSPTEGVFKMMQWNSNLLVGGRFASANNGSPVPNTKGIAIWDGVSWSPAPEGDVPGNTNGLSDFIQYQLQLHTSGEFTTIGSISASGVAKSNGTTWINVGHPNGITWALETYDACGTLSCDLYSAGEAFVNKYNCILINNEDKTRSFEVYPNPVSDQLTLLFGQDPVTNYLVKIRSVNGQELWSMQLVGQKSEISTATLPSGIYLLECIVGAKNRWIVKIIKQ